MKRWIAFSFLLASPILSLIAQEPSPDSGSFEVEPPSWCSRMEHRCAGKASPAPHRDLAQLKNSWSGRKKVRLQPNDFFIGPESLRKWKRNSELCCRAVAGGICQGATRSDPEQVGKGSNDGIVQVQSPVRDDLKAVLAQASAAEKEAAANLAKAELDAAILNLQRQQKLRALGSARKSDVARAEEKLTALKREQH